MRRPLPRADSVAAVAVLCALVSIAPGCMRAIWLPLADDAPDAPPAVIDGAPHDDGGQPDRPADAPADLGVDAPLPDLGVDAPLPDLGVDAPLPDLGVDAPLPDLGVDTVDLALDAPPDQQADAAPALSWTSLPVPSGWFFDIWGLSDSAVYLVGEFGAFHHFDGTQWQTVATGTSDQLHDVWAVGPAQVFVVGESGIALQYDGTGITSTETITTGGLNLYALWGSAASNVFAMGQSGVTRRFDGTSWSALGSASTHVKAIWGNAPTFAVAVGWSGLVLRYDGTSWAAEGPIAGSPNLEGVWGSSRSDVYAVGGTSVYHSPNGAGSWTSVFNPPGSTFAVHGSSPTDVFVVGSDRGIWRYDGSGWSTIPSELPGVPISPAFTGVWVAPDLSVYLCGTNNTARLGTR